MTATPGAQALSPRALFWFQVGLGAPAVVGTAVGLGLADLGVVGLWTAGALVLAWLGGTLAGLVALERRKPPPAARHSPEEWAHSVRQLRASRLEIVTAFEIERRRVERDLHDGTQQHLVAASMKVGEASLLLDTPDTGAPVHAVKLLGDAQDDVEAALAALRSTVTGIHPTVLSDLGLEAAVRDLTDRSMADVVVRVPHPLPAVPEALAAAVYFLTAEALTNVTKHAPRAHVTVLLSADEHLHLSVVDDGPGGATIQPGRGLAGMTERLAAFGGTLTVSSPPGGPTALTARVPLLLPQGHPGIVLETATHQGPR